MPVIKKKDTIPPVPGMINPNAVNSNKLISNTNNANITAGSIGKDIFSGNTSTNNITTPISSPSKIGPPKNIGNNIGGGSVTNNQFTTPGGTIVDTISKNTITPPKDSIGNSKDTTIPLDTTGTPKGNTGAPKDYTPLDTNKDGIIQGNELTGDFKTFYDGLSDLEKKTFLAVGENAMKKNLDVSTSYANYMRDFNTVKGRKQSDEAYRLKQQEIRDNIANIQENQTLRRAKSSVDNLKQSIAYLGNLGMPGVSGQRVVSLDNKIQEADKSLNETKNLLALSKSARKNGHIQQALQYERQMEDITTKLNDNVDKTIQGAFNSMISADNNGKLDTISELTAFRDKLYKELDRNITGFTDASINQLGFLVKRVDIARQEAINFDNNANTINSDLSAVKGYYMNGNGEPIYGNNGQTIKIPKAIPKGFEPFISNGKFFSPKIGNDGEVVLDTNGSPIFNSTQLEDTVSVTGKLANAYIDMVNKGVMTPQEAIKNVPELANNEAFINGIKQTDTTTTTPKLQSIGKDKNGNDILGTYNPNTKQWEKIKTDIGEINSNIIKEDAVLGKYKLSDGSTITASKGTVNGLNKVMAENPDIQFDLNNLYRTQEDQYRLYGQGRTEAQLKAEGIDPIYSNIDKPIVTYTTKSSHMTGNAVDVVVPAGQDKVEYTQSIEPLMNKNGFFRPDGTVANGDYGHFQYKGVKKPVELNTSDISRFNNSTFKYKNLKTNEDKKKYQIYQNKKDTLYNDPYATPIDLISFSKGSGKGSVAERDKMGKYGQVLGGLETLTGLIKKQETGPVAGRLSQLNPYSTNVAEFKAVIAGLVPTVARGVFNEVGVLTDADIKQYLGTLPTLTKTKDQNKLVTTALLDVLKTGMEKQLGTMARSDVDVSKFVGSIKRMNSTITRLKNELGMGAKEQLKVKGGNLGSVSAGIGAALGTEKKPVLDNIDSGFFNGTGKGEVNTGSFDKIDENFFNNL